MSISIKKDLYEHILVNEFKSLTYFERKEEKFYHKKSSSKNVIHLPASQVHAMRAKLNNYSNAFCSEKVHKLLGGGVIRCQLLNRHKTDLYFHRIHISSHSPLSIRDAIPRCQAIRGYHHSGTNGKQQ